MKTAMPFTGGLELFSYLLVLAFSLYMTWPVFAGFALGLQH